MRQSQKMQMWRIELDGSNQDETVYVNLLHGASTVQRFTVRPGEAVDLRISESGVKFMGHHASLLFAKFGETAK